jgi:salicylate hydroxylase
MLTVLIVGGGIAGLTSALSLRRAGHKVHIFERSAFNNEVGAAIHVPPNASRALLAWGFDPVRAKLITAKSSFRANGRTLETIMDVRLEGIEEQYGSPWFLAHRVDLHEELKRLAMGDGVGIPAKMHLRSEVVRYVSMARNV